MSDDPFSSKHSMTQIAQQFRDLNITRMEIAKLQLEPSDTLVLKLARKNVQGEVLKRVSDHITKLTGHARVIVIEDGMEVLVVKTEPGEEIVQRPAVEALLRQIVRDEIQSDQLVRQK